MGAVAISSELAVDDEFVPNAWHLLGTCRMGNAPAASATNRWHQSWDVPNLFICDSSSLVTSGAVNPTSTICALVARLAHSLRANRDRGRTARRTTAEG